MRSHRNPRPKVSKGPTPGNQRPALPTSAPAVDPASAEGRDEKDDAQAPASCADLTACHPREADHGAHEDDGFEFDVEQEFSLLQSDVRLVDALIYATEQHFERFGWQCRDEGDEGDEPLEHLAHLIYAARLAAHNAVLKSEVFARDLLNSQARWNA